MDWYPLYNSLRIAAISCFLVFFTGIFAAYYVARLPRWIKGVLDVVLTLPMVLPPTVVGYFILLLFGVKRPLGMFLSQFGIKFVMTWYGGILAASVVALKALTIPWPMPGKRLDCPIPTSSGASACPIAGRVSWPVRCWPLPEPWVNTVLPACSLAIRPAVRPPSPQLFISCGAPMMRAALSSG